MSSLFLSLLDVCLTILILEATCHQLLFYFLTPNLTAVQVGVPRQVSEVAALFIGSSLPCETLACVLVSLSIDSDSTADLCPVEAPVVLGYGTVLEKGKSQLQLHRRSGSQITCALVCLIRNICKWHICPCPTVTCCCS